MTGYKVGFTISGHENTEPMVVLRVWHKLCWISKVFYGSSFVSHCTNAKLYFFINLWNVKNRWSVTFSHLVFTLFVHLDLTMFVGLLFQRDKLLSLSFLSFSARLVNLPFNLFRLVYFTKSRTDLRIFKMSKAEVQQCSFLLNRS